MDDKTRDRVAVLRRKAWTSVDAGNVEDMNAFFDEAEQLSPQDPGLRLERGVGYFKLQRHDEALVCFDAVLALQPNNILALNNRAKVLVALKRPKEALATYKQALDIDVKHAKTWYNCGLLLEQESKWEQAEKCFSKVLELTPHDPDAWHHQGRVVWRQGRTQPAFDLLDRAVRLREDFYGAQFDLGRLLIELGQPDAGAQALAIAAKADPKNPEGHCALGQVLLQLAHAREAMSCFDKALDCDQNFSDAWEGKGRCLMATDDSPRGHLYIGMALHQRGQHEAALAEIDLALKERERFLEAWANRAQVLEALQRHEEALQSYDRALEIHPGAVDLYHNKGLLLLRKLGRETEGLKCFQRVVALDSKRWFKLPKEIREGMEKL